MTNHAFRALQGIIKQLTVLLVSVVILLSLTQTAVLAASATELKLHGTPGITAPIPGENVSELKEQRREWQEKESSHDVENDKGSSLGETLKKKLNLDEITEGYHPEKEAEKHSSPTS
ncbi:hypothetical protein JOY44_06580 [Phormidium sp. CLA17]|uniref:hypothetical protein n=1 Tax=Leptolyngbya sp. Cla-17 TaxID=2803751 RepID=UPI0014911D3C|nr:hypothetical protein [Leptolyngbya sp. Cla-17]MBM0741286.1 hypothetical protein [Leptolyngbya sp. Cla-17]